MLSKKDAFTENIISKRLLQNNRSKALDVLLRDTSSTTDGDIGSVLGWGFPRLHRWSSILYRLHRNGKFYKGL